MARAVAARETLAPTALKTLVCAARAAAGDDRRPCELSARSSSSMQSTRTMGRGRHASFWSGLIALRDAQERTSAAERGSPSRPGEQPSASHLSPRKQRTRRFHLCRSFYNSSRQRAPSAQPFAPQQPRTASPQKKLSAQPVRRRRRDTTTKMLSVLSGTARQPFAQPPRPPVPGHAWHVVAERCEVRASKVTRSRSCVVSECFEPECFKCCPCFGTRKM